MTLYNQTCLDKNRFVVNQKNNAVLIWTVFRTINGIDIFFNSDCNVGSNFLFEMRKIFLSFAVFISIVVATML